MNWPQEVQAGVLFATAASAVALAVHAWRRRQLPAAQPLAAMAASVVVWAGSAGAQFLTNSPGAARFWGTLIYAGTFGVTSAWLAFCLKHTGRHPPRPWHLAGLGAAIGILLTLLVATSDFHSLFWRHVMVEGRPREIPAVGYWLFLFYNQALALAGLGLIGLELLLQAEPYRRQNATILAAGLVPLVVSLLHEFAGWPSGLADPTPCGLLLSILLIGWGLFRQGILDLIPVARSAVVASLTDGMLVVDVRERILDFNPAAQGLFDEVSRAGIGMPASEVIRAWPDIVAAVSGADGRSTPMQLCSDHAPRFLEVRRENLPGPHGELRAHLYLFRDVTLRHQAELEREKLLAQLQTALGQVKTLSGLLPICSACSKVRDKAGGWLELGTYLSRHTNANLTHGLCPECVDRLYPELRPR